MDYFSLPIGPNARQPAPDFLAQTPKPYVDADLAALERCPHLPTPAFTRPPTLTPNSTLNAPPPFPPLTLPSRRPAATSQATAPCTTQTPVTTTCVPRTPPPQPQQRTPPPRRCTLLKTAMRVKFKRLKNNMHKICKR